MYEKVTRWQTKDGELHESEKSADAHIVRVLEDGIGPIIDGVNKNLNPNHVMGPVTKLALVDALVGTPQRARKLKRLLDTVIE